MIADTVDLHSGTGTRCQLSCVLLHAAVRPQMYWIATIHASGGVRTDYGNVPWLYQTGHMAGRTYAYEQPMGERTRTHNSKAQIEARADKLHLEAISSIHHMPCLQPDCVRLPSGNLAWLLLLSVYCLLCSCPRRRGCSSCHSRTCSRTSTSAGFRLASVPTGTRLERSAVTSCTLCSLPV